MKAYFVIGLNELLYTKVLSIAFSLGYTWPSASLGNNYKFENIKSYGDEGIGLIFTFDRKRIQYTGLEKLADTPNLYFRIRNVSNLINWLKTGKTKVRIG